MVCEPIENFRKNKLPRVIEPIGRHLQKQYQIMLSTKKISKKSHFFLDKSHFTIVNEIHLHRSCLAAKVMVCEPIENFRKNKLPRVIEPIGRHLQKQYQIMLSTKKISKKSHFFLDKSHFTIM